MTKHRLAGSASRDRRGNGLVPGFATLGLIVLVATSVSCGEKRADCRAVVDGIAQTAQLQTEAECQNFCSQLRAMDPERTLVTSCDWLGSVVAPTEPPLIP